MAIGIVHRWPGGTKEHYEAAVVAAHPPDALPEGQTHHFAGPTEGGWQVVAIWDSQEQLDAFIATMPSTLEALGDKAFPAPPEQIIFEVDTAAFG